MKCVLIRDVNVERWSVFAELQWMERRPELGVLCRAALQQGRFSPALVELVLPGVSRRGAENLIAWCTMLGLCDRTGTLSSIAEMTAKTDQAPVPEQGVFDLWIVEHPLFDRRVLHAERVTTHQEVNAEQLETLQLDGLRRRWFRSVIDPDACFSFVGWPAHHQHASCVRQRTESRCSVRWTFNWEPPAASHNQWQLEGYLDGRGRVVRRFEHEPETIALQLASVLESWAIEPLSRLGRWRTELSRLAVSFDSTDEAQQESFVRELELENVSVANRGSFDKAQIEQLPIGPGTPMDAQRWAMARLRRAIVNMPKYRDRSDVELLFGTQTNGTPLEPFFLRPPPQTDVLRELEDVPEAFWSVAAPADLISAEAR